MFLYFLVNNIIDKIIYYMYIAGIYYLLLLRRERMPLRGGLPYRATIAIDSFVTPRRGPVGPSGCEYFTNL